LDLSVGECESDHSETTRMTRLREKRHSSFSQILMRGSISAACAAVCLSLGS
jgi:hypothetical protein